MTLVLRNEEKIENQLEINSVYGKGILYVTTNAVVAEINKKGIVFERLHNQIALVEATEKKKIKITWPEGRQLFDFTFKVNDAQKHVKEIVEQHNYEDNFPDLMGVNSIMLSEKEQKEIVEKRTKNAKENIDLFKKQLDEANLKLNMIASDDPDKANKILKAAEQTKKIHDILEMWTQYKKDIPNIIMNRSKKIPKEILDYRCWNDCWFDIKSDCFVTFNKILDVDWFDEIELIKKFQEKNTVPNIYAIPYDFIEYNNGYPVYRYKNKENEMLTVLLSTMTDEMLNDDLISKKIGLDIDTVGDGYPVEIKKSLVYKVSSGSKLILKNGQKSNLTRKETVFFLNRKMISKEQIELLP